MTAIRSFAAYMLVFTVGLFLGDWLWGGIKRVEEMWALRIVVGLAAVALVWSFRLLRSSRS